MRPTEPYGWMICGVGVDGTARRYCQEGGDPLPQTMAAGAVFCSGHSTARYTAPEGLLTFTTDVKASSGVKSVKVLVWSANRPSRRRS